MRALVALAFYQVLLFPLAAQGQPQDPQILVKAALQRLDDANQDEAWFFTLRLAENEELRVISHDPSAADPYLQRTLVSVDGETPDDDRLEDFRDTEKKRIDDRDPEGSFSQLVDLDSLSWSQSDGQFEHFTFSPRVKALEEARDKMRGALTLETKTGQIRDIEVFNAEPFSPAFSVTLDTYKLSFSFREEQGTRLLDRMESRAVGRAGFVKSFDNLVVVDFTDYRPLDVPPTD